MGGSRGAGFMIIRTPIARERTSCNFFPPDFAEKRGAAVGGGTVKRSRWISGTIVAQFLCGGLFLGTSVVLFFLMHQPAVNEAGAAPGLPSQALKFAAAILASFGTAVFVGAWGLAGVRYGDGGLHFS